MRKVLSLKKSQTQPPKSQKSITNFFKVEPAPFQTVTKCETKGEAKVAKRKAISPTHVDLPKLTKTSPRKENLRVNQAKKHKIQDDSDKIKIISKKNKEKLPSPHYDKSNSEHCMEKRSPLSDYNHEIEDNIQTGITCLFHNKVLKTPEKINANETMPSCNDISKNTILHNKEEAHNKIVTSPSKIITSTQVLDFDNEENVDDLFGDEWDIKEVEDDGREDLDLSTIQRCEILSLKNYPTKLELRLKNSADNRCTCYVEGVWINTPLQSGEIISVLAARNAQGQYSVNNTSGLLSLRPDYLISTTSVVAGVFCKRKAILQERWKGIDAANVAMTVGILIHELVQKALTQHISNVVDLRRTCESIIKESLHMLFDAGISEMEAVTNMEQYITPLAEFMQIYVTNNNMTLKDKTAKWNGHIDDVLDIEENICCPKLGLKGKIDATLQVTVHDRKGKHREIVPLELKSGRASGSAEHRGQLVLYGMMLSLQQNEDPALTMQRGLLLYLKDQVDLREVSCGYPERRDLLLLRNELVQHLASGPQSLKTEELVDIEEASKLLQQSLPEPVHHENACTKCPYLTLCSLHLWHTNDVKVSETHPLARLRGTALGHLTKEHVSYFLHWTSLLKMEEKAQMSNSPLHALWTDSAKKRAIRGTCAASLKLKSVQTIEDRYAHVFERSEKDNEDINGPKEGDFSIVSLDDRPWIAAGVVTLASHREIHILLERNLTQRHKHSTFHIDTYESYNASVQNLTNLGVLMEDSDRAVRLRKLIIDKDPPEFIEKLPREVGRIGSKLMRSLNIEQQRAVLKALSANDYVLLQGLPGTGKTQTISVLIQMLVALKQRVLVTAHTHSAVDTVLTRLPESMRVLRLGSSSRIAPNLISRAEATLTNNCKSAKDLSDLYDSMDVVGVTCLGANHALLSRTTFDICIVDEATQVLQSTVLRPLFAAKRFVLVGDPEQLPPVVKSKAARRFGMEESLFHRLMGDQSTCTLRLQYRMNRGLVDIANRVAYSQRLKCASKTVAESTMSIDVKKLSRLHSSKWLLEACSLEAANAAVFLNIESTDVNSKGLINIAEAKVAVILARTFIEIGVQSSDIGVIAPYRDQVSLLREMLSKLRVEASTVDQFQGRDKSVILYSCTKRETNDKVKEGEILNDQRRLAVSVTRAKHKFIALGNARVLRRYAPLSKLIDACKLIDMDQETLELNND
ncbi:unnamed protein product [Leptosia nina]|uniref:DNA helicase n=1 Tax=Leptosia nina TaxID=320188 RepID=A0AAV1J0U4_9NEOP